MFVTKTPRFTAIGPAMLLAVGMIGSGRASQPVFTAGFTNIDVPGASFTEALGINTGGDIVGLYVTSGPVAVTHGFLRSRGAFSPIDVPGAIATEALGINDQGDIVGTYFTPPFSPFSLCAHGFLLSHGSFTTFDVDGQTGSCGTKAYGINSRGEIVGQYGDEENFNNHGFLWSKGAFTTIDAPDGNLGTWAYGINSQGEMVGAYRNFPTGFHGFRLSNGVFTIMEVNAATGISPEGDVVAGGSLLSNGEFTNVEVPGAFFTDAVGINSRGDIVGSYGNSTGYHGFLLRR